MRELMPMDLVYGAIGVGLALAIGTLMVAWPLLWPWLVARRGAALPAALVVLGTGAGAVAGEPLLGLVAGVAVAALVAWRPTVNQAMGPADDYVDDDAAADDPRELPVPAFERAERPQIVQPERALNGEPLSPEDVITIDKCARLLAAGVQGEAAAIELLFDGVRRGGSRRYQTIRDEVRMVAAARYGWKSLLPPEAPAPEPPAEVKPVSGAPRPPGVVYAGEVAED